MQSGTTMVQRAVRRRRKVSLLAQCLRFKPACLLAGFVGLQALTFFATLCFWNAAPVTGTPQIQADTWRAGFGAPHVDINLIR